MLGRDVRVVDNRKATGSVVRTERAPGRRKDRRLGLETAGWIRLGMRMFRVRNGYRLPSVHGRSGIGTGILDTRKASRA